MTYLTDCNWIEKPYLDSKVNHHSTTPSLFKQTFTNILKIKNSILFTIIFVAFGQVGWGQDAVGDFQSKVITGDWGAYTSWKRCSVAGTPGTFIDAELGQVPGSSNAVSILNGHTITLNATPLSVKNLNIENGGILACTENYIFNIHGDFTNNGTFNSTAGTVNMAPTTPVDQTISGTGILNFYNLTIANTNKFVTVNTNLNIGKNLKINSGTFYCPGTQKISVSGNFSGASTTGFSAGKSTVEMKSSSTQTIDGSNLTFYNLIVSNTVTISVKNLSINSNINVINSLTINSDCAITPSASVLINKELKQGTLTSSGIIKVTYSAGFRGQYNFSTINNIPILEYVGDGQIAITSNSDYTISTLIINNNRTTDAPASFTLIEGPTTCSFLNILLGALTIKPGGSLNVIGTIDGSVNLGHAGDCLILQSDISNSPSFIFKNDNYTGNGTVRFERYTSKLPSYLDIIDEDYLPDLWHLFSSPIKNQSIHNFILNNLQIPLLTGGTGKVGMCDYNTTNDSWNPYYVYINDSPNDPPDNLDSGKGFSILAFNGDQKGTGMIYATGKLNPHDEIKIKVLSDKNGWNCIGNPYTCSLKTGQFISDNSALIDNGSYKALYLWNGRTGIYEANEAIGGPDVQVGQGFFVKARESGEIVFNANQQIVNTESLFKTATIVWPSIKIAVQSKTLKSITKIKFVTNSTKGLDPGYDAGMLKANADFAIYSRLLEDNGVDFTLQCLPDKNYDQYIVPIGIDCKVAGDITFTAETVNLPVGCLAVLEDRLTKQFTRLDQKDAKYTTTVSANTKGTGRFFLHTSDVISGDQPIGKEPFKISKIGKTLYINGEVSGKANFYVYSVNGKQLANFKAESQVQNQFDASGLPAGVYILTCDDQNQNKSTKFVIEN